MKKNKISEMYDEENWDNDIEYEEIGGYPSEEDDISEQQFYKRNWYTYEE